MSNPFGTTAHEEFAAIRAAGAAQFDATALAHGHTAVARRVGRARVAHATTASVASVGLIGAIAIGGFALAHRDGIAPASPSPSAPQATATSTQGVRATVEVAPGERAEDVIASFATAFDVTQAEARAALIAALPPEASGNPEGWLATGEYVLDAGTTLDDAVALPVSTLIDQLESLDVAEADWGRTLTVASVIEQETPGYDTMGMTARVIYNRIDAGMSLQLESPLRYVTHADTQVVGDDAFAVDSPYNTYMYKGLPKGPIGAPTSDALAAASHPTPGTWLFFVVDPTTHEVFFSSSFEDHEANVARLFPDVGASD